MNTHPQRRSARLSVRTRLFLSAGTAIPLAALAMSAHAASIEQASDTDIEVTAPDASGTPVAVELSSSGGSVTASVTTVTGSATADQRDYIVGLETLTGGDITGNFGSITGTGTGQVLGLGAETYAGDIDLTVGTVDVSGAATAGISATSQDGAIAIAADSVIARGTGVDSGSEFYEAVYGNSYNNSVTIDVGSAETYGAQGSAIGAIAGGTATITADNATAHGEGIVVAYANSAGDASVDIGSVTLDAENGQGVYVTSNGGNAHLAVDTIEGGALSEGARVLAAEDIDVTLGDVVAGGGLTARSTNGDTAITFTGDLVGTTYGGLEGTGQNVSVTMGEGSSITTAGSTWNGIYALGTESVAIVATDIAAQGQGIRGDSANGSVDIQVSGDISAVDSNAISVNGKTVNIEIGADSVVTGGAGSSVIAAGATNNGGGTLTVVNDGTVVGLGGIGSGIGVTGTGDVSVTSNAVSLEGAANPASSFVSAGISAASNGGGDVTVDAGTTEVGGQQRHGIYATATGDGTVTIAADTTTSEADGFSTIAAQSEAGAISIDSGTVVSGGVGAKGIEAVSYDGGDISITSGTLTNTAEGALDGSTAEGIYADTRGAVTIDSGSAEVHGYGASAIAVLAGDDVSITSDSAATYGDESTAIYAGTLAGDVVVDSGSITTEGVWASAIGVGTDAGAVSVTSGSIDTVGQGAFAIQAIGTTGVTVVSDSISATGLDAFGIYAKTTDGDVSVTSGDLTAGEFGVYGRSETGDVAITLNGDTVAGTNDDTGFADAVRGIGQNVSITSAEGTTSSGGYGFQAIAGDSATIVNEGTVIATADLGSAIHVTAPGAVSITSNAVQVTGAGADPGERSDGSGYRLEQGGIIVEGGDGDIAIDAGSVDVEGEYRYGISARGNGAIAIAADDVTLASADSVAVAARGGAGDVTLTTGTVTTTGASGAGVLGTTTTGNVVIDAGTTRVEHDGMAGSFTGDAVVGVSDSGTVTITSENAYSAGLYGTAVAGVSGGDVSVTSGTAETTGDSGVAVLAQSYDGNATADVEVINTSGNGEGVEVIADNGEASLTLGTLTATGENATGVYVRSTNGTASIVTTGDVSVAGSYAIYGRGAHVSVETGEGTTTTGKAGILINNNTQGAEVTNLGTVIGTGTGAGSGGISVTSGSNIDITSNAVESTGDLSYGIYAQSSLGNVTIDAASVVLSGDQQPLSQPTPGGQPVVTDNAAIRANSAQGAVTVNVGDITATGAHGRGVNATGRTVSVTVDGTVDTAEQGVIASGREGVDVLVNGTITAAATAGVAAVGVQGTVEVAEGASVTGQTAGVGMTGTGAQRGFFELYNNGTIAATAGPAVIGNVTGPNSTDFYIQNNGVLVGGTGGVAVRTLGGDDTVELTELSQITGVVDLGDGDDRLQLDFNDDAAAGAVGQVASTVNVEGLSVDTGSWLANGVQSSYDFVDLEEGATLTVAENADGELAISTPYIELGGTLNLDLATDTEAGDLTGLVIEGEGSLHLIGGATVLVDDASGLQHTGGTFVENGGLLLTDVYGGDITTSGAGVFTLGEGGDFTGNLVNDGAFVFAQGGDYSFLGDFSGSGLLEKQGDGKLTFAGLYAFEGTTSVLGGAVAFTGQLSEDTQLDLSGDGVVDLSQVEGGTQTIAQLSGSGGALELGSTELVIDQSANTVFAGTLSGTGPLVKAGEGDLKLNGDGTGFTGTASVDGGTLSVNGNFANASFEVNEGGKLGGNGTVGDTVVDGGKVGPGNSIGLLTVAGDLAFTASSVYEVEVNAAGAADRIDVTGTATLGGAAVNVLAASGTYRPLTDYTILTAATVSGTFGSVTSNLAFLDPSLSYTGTAVTLRLVRNDIDFAAYGATPNQTAIGNLIESFGYGNALYDAALTLIDSDVAPSFASLTGDVYPAYASATFETAEMLRRQTAGQMAGEGTYVWGTGLYNRVSSGSGAGEIELESTGAAGGLGFGAGGFSAAAGLGFLDQGRGGEQFSDGDVTFAIGQVAYASPAGFSVSAGVQYGWVEADTRRQTTLGTISQAVTGKIDGHYLQLFGEVSYKAQLAGFALEPFAGISHVSADFDGLTEVGAPTALAVGEIDRDVTFADLGLRLSADTGTGVRPFASAAYRTAWGDRASTATVGFAGLTGTAVIGAVPVAKSAAELSAGLALTRGPLDFKVSYDGTLSKQFDSHAITAGLKFHF